ncbi:MAG: hypothetical protein ACXVBE_07210 [Bdellovibrionota bacterium]
MKVCIAYAALIFLVSPLFAHAEVSYTFKLPPAEVTALKLDARSGHLSLESKDAAGEFESRESGCPRIVLLKGSHGADSNDLNYESQWLVHQNGNVFYRKEGGMGYGTGWDGNPVGEPVDFGPLKETKAEFITPDSLNFTKTGSQSCHYTRALK